MTTITFERGTIQVVLPKNTLSTGVKNPGQPYMDAAYEILKNVQQYLADYGRLPNVEDVAYNLKEVLPPCPQ